MSFVLAGAASGLFMASVFISVGPVIIFVIAREPPPAFRDFLLKVPPLAIMLSLLVIAYPTWAVLGAVIGILFGASTTESSPAGIGSPNLVYSAVIVLVAVALAVPLGLLLKGALIGVVAMAISFVGIFGWLLPFLAG